MGAPVKYTCPLIDSMISDLKGIMQQIQEDYPDEARQIDSIIDRRGGLEEVRDANNSLRNWGYDSESRIEVLEKELEEANDKVSDLQYQIDNME